MKYFLSILLLSSMCLAQNYGLEVFSLQGGCPAESGYLTVAQMPGTTHTRIVVSDYRVTEMRVLMFGLDSVNKTWPPLPINCVLHVNIWTVVVLPVGVRDFVSMTVPVNTVTPYFYVQSFGLSSWELSDAWRCRVLDRPWP